MPYGAALPQTLSHSPRVWVLTSRRAGDNAQVLALAEALGLPFEVKEFAYKRFEFLPSVLLHTTLAGIDREQSSPLEAPWPDLVISANRRNEPIARWIKQQVPEKVRLVHVGRPWTGTDCFDLVVTTPQYRLPVRSNILHNKTPLHRVTRERLTREAQRWMGRLAHLPRPFIAVNIGGSSGPYCFDQRAAERLAREASALARACGGSLLISTSARTPAVAIDTLEENITAPACLFRWTKDARDNPYFAFLGLADSVVVTGDSISMLAEACATRKPVHIFDVGEGEHAMRPETAAAAAAGRSGFTPIAAVRRLLEPGQLKAAFYRFLMAVGPRGLTRDIRLVHGHLVDSGRAMWLGEPFPARRPIPALDCLPRAAGRVRAIMEATARPRVPAGERVQPMVTLRRSA